MTAKGWVIAPLGDIAKLHQGFGFPKSLQGRSRGEIGFYKVSDISRAVSAGSDHLGPAVHYITSEEARAIRARVLPKGAVVFARIGEALKLNRRALLPTDALVDNNVIGVKGLPGIEDRYLLYFLRTIDLGTLSQATAVPAVRTSDIQSIQVPVAPCKEQARIVSRLDELFSCIDEGERALERVQKLIERYRQSVLKAAVTGELTRERREKHKGTLESGDALLKRILKARREAWEHAELDRIRSNGQKPLGDRWKANYLEPLPPPTTQLPELPHGWVWASLDQLTVKITSGSRDWKDYYGRGAGVFVMAQNVRPRRLDLSQRQSVDPPPGNRDAERSEVRQHDVLITIVGANTGDVCRVDKPLSMHYVCQSVALVRPVIESLSFFLELYLSCDEGGQSQFAKAMYGAGRPHLSFDQLKGMAVPVPPLEEQRAITDRVERIESDLAPIQRSIHDCTARASGLRRTALRSAFSGLLVAQDLADEPASALLGRIACASTLQATGGSKRKHISSAGDAA